MAKKIVTNEFVVMGEISKDIATYTPHHRAVITTFLISFANFSTIGMIIGTLIDANGEVLEGASIVEKPTSYTVKGGE